MIYVVGGEGMPTSSALIRVTAFVGSTITFSKGGVAVKTLGSSRGHVNNDTSPNSTAEYYYSISSPNYGSWTITASKSAYDSISKTITVNAAKEYDVELMFDLVLFDQVLHEDYTTVNATMDSSNLKFVNGYITPAIDVTYWNTLKFTVYAKTGNYSIAGLRATPTTSYPGYEGQGYTVWAGGANGLTVGQTYSLDLSNVTGNYYFESTAYQGSATFSRIWLEQHATLS